MALNGRYASLYKLQTSGQQRGREPISLGRIMPANFSTATENQRPPLAVVGSQISQDEELFGRVFDRWVVSRFLVYLRPYRRRIAVAIGAVLLFTLMQLAIPW